MRLTTLAALAALSLTAAATLRAQTSARPYSLGVAAGAAIPTGDLADGSNTGYNVTGHIGFALPALPFDARLEMSYNNFTVQKSQIAGTGIDAASTRSLGFIGDVLYTLPLPSAVIRPYVIGGVGLYNDKLAATSQGVTESINENELGVNGGAGVRIPLTRLTPFAEIRYHHVRVGHKIQGGGTTSSISYVPITFGVSF